MCSMLFIQGCSDTIQIQGNAGIPENTYWGVPPVKPDGNTVGNLTEAYVTNTESLVTVNGRLALLCEAHKVTNCTGPQ